MLYVVATPIGNLSDISERAIDVLRNVTLIACEDTRQTKKLLSACDISSPCISCHSHNQEFVFKNKLLPLLQKGEDIALVSDSGTPAISDPGSLVIDLAYANNIEICPVPGPSALTTLVSVAGLCGKGFHFEGFLQRKSGARSKRLTELMNRNEAYIIYESPHRISKLLLEIIAIDKARQVLLGREMTKKFEQFLRGTALELLTQWENGEIVSKGECAVLVYPAKK